MRIDLAAAKIVEAVTHGIPGRKASTVVKYELLRAHDAGVESMRRCLAEALRKEIKEARESASDEMWGERANLDSAHYRIQHAEELLGRLGHVAISARKMKAFITCNKCGGDVSRMDDMTCPHCGALLLRPL